MSFFFEVLIGGLLAYLFLNGMTTYLLLGVQDDKKIEAAIDRLAKNKINRIRVAINARTTSGERWFEPQVKNSDQFNEEYFKGLRKQFDLPLSLRGSDFQMQAWKVLQTIPFGQTISYGEQAKKLGNAKASRAVGAANGRNPLPIIIPCHRVIGTNRTLTGFNGGLDRKQILLQIEGVLTKR